MAAIIGKTVSFKLLESIYPIPDAKSELLENLLALRKLGILSLEDGSLEKSKSARMRARTQDNAPRVGEKRSPQDNAHTRTKEKRSPEKTRARIQTQEAALAQRDARVLEQVHGTVTYSFKDFLYMEVAYNMMLFAQKRQLHEQVAKWYEAALQSLPRNKHRYPLFHIPFPSFFIFIFFSEIFFETSTVLSLIQNH